MDRERASLLLELNGRGRDHLLYLLQGVNVRVRVLPVGPSQARCALITSLADDDEPVREAALILGVLAHDVLYD